MMTSAKVLIVEDDWLVAHELARTLEEDGYQVVAIANNGTDAIRLAESHKPEVVLMDLCLDGQIGGGGAASEIQTKQAAEIIFVTGHTDQVALEAAKQVRSSGYLVKPCTREQLRASVEIAVANLHRQALEAREATCCTAGQDAEEAELSALSEREREVFEYLASGERVAEVATKLFISSHTVRKHSKAIFRKLSVHSQVELIRRFGRRRLPA